MKKYIITGIAVVMGMLTVGALSASAADASGYCFNNQSYQQFVKETAPLQSALKAKESELTAQSAYTISEESRNSTPDVAKINELESQIKELKGKINAAAQKYGAPVVTALSQSNN